MLQLTPTNRPLFTCKRCGFANTYIPLCLWCSWTSKGAQDDFELSQPRARRASAPPKVVWRQTCRAANIHDASNTPSTQSTPQKHDSPYIVHLATTFDNMRKAGLLPINGNSASESRSLDPLPLPEANELNQSSTRKESPFDDTTYETAFGDFVVVPREVATATVTVWVPSL